MVIFKCYFSGELIALSFKKIKKNNNGVNIELGKTDRLKALCMMQIKNEINKSINQGLFSIQTNNNNNIHTFVYMNTERAGNKVKLLILVSSQIKWQE